MCRFNRGPPVLRNPMVINEKQTTSRGGIIRLFIGHCPRRVVLFELLSQWLFVGHCPRHVKMVFELLSQWLFVSHCPSAGYL